MRQEIQITFEAWLTSYSTLSPARDDHGYTDMTVEMLWHAWRAGVAHGRAQAASAASETVRATIIVDGETQEELLACIAGRVDDVGKPTHWVPDELCALQTLDSKPLISGD
ncbi:MAG: hypothetical protein BWY31_02405 [Lentisphaerae bacterium ADurb.Bin242]|nr:MAG: hypothetical protein BWY31_02405 [Lentisphaerae bacterium ADurb.Bin242]